MQSISIGFGKINFDTSSVSLSAHVVQPPWIREFPSRIYNKQGKFQRFPASAYPDINGNLNVETVQIPQDGPIFVFQSSQRLRGASIRDGAVWMRLREQGPALTISARLMPHRDSLVGDNFLMFQGRGDLLSLEEAADAGIVPGKAWIDGFMDSEEIDQLFDIHELAPQTAPQPKLEYVRTMSGKEVVLQSAQQGRRIRVK